MRFPIHWLAIVPLVAAWGCGQKLNPGGDGVVANSNAALNVNNTTGCVAATVSYSSGASAVIASKCASCHVGGSAPELGSYAQAKLGFTTGGGQAAVDAGSMPIGTSLSAQQKCVLQNWKAGGYAQ